MGSNDMSSSEDDKDVFLGDAINIATRSVHTKHNKLILLRLPLAIPPRADGPSAYIQGILHIAALYISFESLWHSALHAHESSSSSDHHDTAHSRPFPFRTDSGISGTGGPQPTPRMRAILDQLFIPGLLRASRLRSDLRSLTGWSDSALQARLEEVATSGRLGEIVAHIRRAVERHPHVLLSYAWVLYMALFSGGRYIRASLESAGSSTHGFWTTSVTEDGTSSKQFARQTMPVHGPLDFFHFPTPQDGEDLKHEFKQRLAGVSQTLTREERDDVVRETVCIFENLVLLIGQLDDVCHTKMSDLNAVDASVLSPRSAAFRIRDSVIVTRERSYRAAQRNQPEDAGEEEEEADDDDDGGQALPPDSKESSSSSPSTTSSSGSTSSDAESAPQPRGGNNTRVQQPYPQPPSKPDRPVAERQKSCHTVVLASASPRVERDDPFSSSRIGRWMTSAGDGDGDGNGGTPSSSMDLELADRLARAMRFDPQLPVPERTETKSDTRGEEPPLAVNDGGADMTDSSPVGREENPGDGIAESHPARKRGDSTFMMGVQVASALGLAVAAAVAYSRG